MKKVVLVALVALFCVALVGCTGQNDNNSSDEQSKVVVGGWQDAEDGTITAEHTAMFAKALANSTGVSYTPIKLLATQVVSGKNYKFLCEQTTISASATKSYKYVTIYVDLEGNCEIAKVEDAPSAE